MSLLIKLSMPFSNELDKEADNNTNLFKLGEDISKLECKRNKLFEKLGEKVYHQKLELMTSIKAEIQLIDQEIIRKTNEMEKLSN